MSDDKCTQPATVHVFQAKGQPATRFVDRNIDPPITTRLSPRHQLHCYLCERRRTAKNLVVHVYYDCIRFFCREGHILTGGRWPKHVTAGAQS